MRYHTVPTDDARCALQCMPTVVRRRLDVIRPLSAWQRVEALMALRREDEEQS